jgi:hypothetical protein
MMAGANAFDRKTIATEYLTFPSLTFCPQGLGFNLSHVKVSV